MKCPALEKNLGLYLQGSLADELRAEMRLHLQTCASCRELVAFAGNSIETQPDRPREFLNSVLSRTSGSACVKACDLLCERIDNRPQVVDQHLLNGHLSTCPDCAVVAATLELMGNELPFLAEIDPGEAFAESVFLRTSRAPATTDPWADRLRGWWGALIRRPRFSWEAAYVGTLLVVLALGNPLSPSYGSFRGFEIKQSVSLNRLSAQVPQTWDAIDKGAAWTKTTAVRIVGFCDSAKHFALSIAGQVPVQARELGIKIMSVAQNFFGTRAFMPMEPNAEDRNEQH
jgi:hypothetical protein